MKHAVDMGIDNRIEIEVGASKLHAVGTNDSSRVRVDGDVDEADDFVPRPTAAAVIGQPTRTAASVVCFLDDGLSAWRRPTNHRPPLTLGVDAHSNR